MECRRGSMDTILFPAQAIDSHFGCRVVAVFVLIGAQLAMAQVHNRITETSDASRVTVYGNIHPFARAQYDEGRVPGSMPMRRLTMVFNRTAEQQSELETLMKQQQDSASSNYHKWLTPAEYATRFGLSEDDLEKVAGWLAMRGFTIVEKANSRSYIVFSGTAAQVEAALGTELHHYEVNGEVHFANAAEPMVPNSLSSVVLGFRALNDFRPRPRHAIVRRLSGVRPEFTSSISGNHFIAPDDFATIYDLKPLYDKGLDGTGQAIAIMGQTDILQSDLQKFRSVSGLPTNTAQVILVPGSPDPGVVQGDITEADLDLEWAGAIARSASLIFVNSGNGVFDSMQYAIDQNLAPVISISYGDCEQNFTSSEVSTLTALLQQANAQGITVAAASGDSGAADCDFPLTSRQVVRSATHGLAVDLPASSPYVTGVGGTQFNEGGNASSYWSSVNNSLNGSALSYIPEAGWNETATELANGGSIAAGGGGASRLFAKPSWQAGNGVPSDNARDVPDISLNAAVTSDGYLICSQGSCVNGYRAADSTLTVVGGTSAGTPAFAGIVALLNQLAGTRQGNVNPKLYQLAATSSDAFHDITSGDNKVPCTAGSTDCPNGGQIGYSAAAGYDLATGLGSIDAYRLVTEYSSAASPPAAPDFQLTGSTQTLTFKRGNSASLTVSVSPLNGFTGTVALTCSVPSTLTNVTCTASPSTIASSGSATVTLTASKHASTMQPFGWPWGPVAGTFALMFGILFVGAGNWQHSNSSKCKTTFHTLATTSMLVLALLAIGCGGGSDSSSSTPVTGTVIIEGTSGADIHSVSVSVTVN
jgi:subtilase family serine protease